MSEETAGKTKQNKIGEILSDLQRQKTALSNFLTRLETMHVELYGTNVAYDTKDTVEEEPQGAYNALRSEITNIEAVIVSIRIALTSLEENL